MRRAEETMSSGPGQMPHGHARGPPPQYRRMYGPGPGPGAGHGHGHGHEAPGYGRVEGSDSRRSHPSSQPQQQTQQHPSNHDEEGVEVVLDRNGGTNMKIVESPVRGRRQDQNVFRGGPPQHHSAHRPRPMRPHAHGHGPPPVHSGGSYGYAHPSAPPPHRRGEYPPHRAAPVQVPYTQSGSFDEGYPAPTQAQHPHYSPQVPYPTPGRGYQAEDVNVISPNHKPDPYNRPPMTPRSRHPSAQYYQYPPTSPVSRPAASHSNPPPRKPYSGMRRSEGPYSAAQRDRDQQSYHPDDGTFNPFPAPSSSEMAGPGRPPLVAESSFDSDNYGSSHQSPYSSHPATPSAPHYDAHSQFYGPGESWGSFDTAPHFDDYRYYGYPPESPYSQYSPHAYYGEGHPHGYERPPYEEDEHGHGRGYHHHEGEGNMVSPGDKRHDGDHGRKTANGIMLPKAASEINFEVTAPPMEPVVPPSDHPVCESPSAIIADDVLCGRGGGTNSQVGNRRFRKLVQEFQPTYLLARRKEKPLLARTIVLIIRKRGGRFLKKDEETGELYEVGDAKAEAKTSQALREGLDVRATKSAATSLVDKKKKKKKNTSKEKEDGKVEEEEEEPKSPETKEAKKEENAALPRVSTPPPPEKSVEAQAAPASPPPSLPRLQQDGKAGVVHPHSPEALQFRKRRRMRSGGCIPTEDKLFPDFCPPRADITRSTSPFGDEMDVASTPPRHNRGMSHEDDNVAYSDPEPQPGCAGIALSIMTGAATGSFCLGPSHWRKQTKGEH